MPRYIDADALIRLLEIDAITQGNYFSKRDAIRCVKAINTEEVLPKSEVEVLAAELSRYTENCKQMIEKAKTEVAREIFEEIQTEIEAALKSNYTAREKRNEDRRWSRINDDFINTVNGKISALRGIDDFIAELKKKYMEVNDA